MSTFAPCAAPPTSVFRECGRPMVYELGGWVSRATPNNAPYFGVDYSDPLNLYAAVGLITGVPNQTMTSPDGINWTQRTPHADQDWRDVRWVVAGAQQRFIAVSASVPGGSSEQCMASADGINWTGHRMPFTPNVPQNHYAAWTALAFSPSLNRLVAVAVLSNSFTAASCDNPHESVLTWVGRTIPALDYLSVCWSPEQGCFVAVGIGATVARSTDGINWTSHAIPLNQLWCSVIWSARLGLFVACSLSGTTQRVMTSPNGINWTLRTTPNRDYRAIIDVPDANRLVMVANTGTGDRSAVSEDGINWSTYPTPTPACDLLWRQLVYAPERKQIVAVASDGTLNRVMTNDLTLLP